MMAGNRRASKPAAFGGQAVKLRGSATQYLIFGE